MEKYKIIGKNIYNFDKKGFIIGVGIIVTWVIIHEELKIGEIIESSQDSN